MTFKLTDSDLAGVLTISSDIHRDKRGYLLETFKSSAFAASGLPDHFQQDLISFSDRGVVRGLHYQLPPGAQGKLIEVVRGTIYDVVVDLRNKSRTFGKWIGFHLSSMDGKGIWIPPGFAHGFQALEDGTLVSYKLTSEYSPESERGIFWNDPFLKIAWPVSNAIISDRDSKHPFFSDADTFPAGSE